jgi:eukaryotic-like serine/threonine-protein kinase
VATGAGAQNSNGDRLVVISDSLWRRVKYIRRHKVPVTAAVLIALSLLGGISATLRQTLIAKASQRFAEGEQGRAETQRLRAEKALLTAEERRQRAEVARTETDQQRTEAELQKLLADEQRTRAEQGEETKRQLLYAAQMRLAQQAWNQADIERMRELLDTQMPQSGQRDLRGFEWYYLWRLAHSDLATLKHTGELSSIVVTPDGAKMASQTILGDIRIWETATGKELAPIHDGEANACCLSISPDGKFFAQNKLNRQIKIYAVSNGAQLSTLEFGQKAGSISTFSPAGKLLAAATTDGTVSVWEVPTWKRQTSFKAFADAVTAVVFTPDSKQLLTGGLEIGVKVWDPLSGRELRTIPIGSGVIARAMAFVPGSNNIVSAHLRNGGLKIWDFATGQPLIEIKTTGATGGLSVSPDGKMIATDHYEKIVRLWSVKNGTLITEIRAHSGPIRAVVLRLMVKVCLRAV